MPACHAGDRRFESGRVRHHARFFLRPVRPPGRGVPLPRDRCADALWQNAPDAAADRRTACPCWSSLGLLVLGLAIPMTGGETRLRRQSDAAGFPDPDRSASALRRARPRRARRRHRRPRRRRHPRQAPCRPRPWHDVPIVPVTQFRAAIDATNRKEVADVLAGTSRRYDALELVADEADAILAALARRAAVRPGPARPRARRRDADPRPGPQPQPARLPAGRRRHAGRPRPRLGRPDAVRGRPRHDGGGVAAAGVATQRRRRSGLRPGRHLDPVRRRRHPARPGRLPDGPDQWQGRRFPVRRWHGRDHRPDVLLAASAGASRRHAPDWEHGGHARAHLRAPTSRSPTSRTRRRTSSAGTRAARSSPPTPGSSTGSSTPASTTSRSPTTTSATPATPASCRRSRTSRSAA